MENKQLIIVSGLPGTGKSTLAEGIAKQLHIAIFSVDPIESAILKAGIKKSFETGVAAYTVAETLANEQLKLNHSVIVDCVSAVEEAKKMWRDLAQKHTARLMVIECVNSNEFQHEQRIEERVRGMHGIPEVTWEDVQKRKSEYIEWDEPLLTVDGADDADANLAKALEYLQQ